MPVNLLLEEPRAESKREPINLLPEESVLARKLPRTKPLVEDLYNSFQSGLAQTWGTVSKMPAAVYDVAAIPQNFLVKSLGREDLQVRSPEWLMNNPVAELYDHIATSYKKEITPTKTFEEAMATKDFNGIGRHLAIQVAESAPQQIGVILSYMSGYPAMGLAGMGLLETTNSLKANRDKDPAISAYNSLSRGVIEAGFENIGTMGILKKWSNVLTKSFGTATTKQIIGDIFKTITYSFLGEGNEEFWTSLAQDFSDFTTGINKDALKGSLERAFEAGSVGGISGALLTSPAAIGTGKRSSSLAKMQQRISQREELPLTIPAVTEKQATISPEIHAEERAKQADPTAEWLRLAYESETNKANSMISGVGVKNPNEEIGKLYYGKDQYIDFGKKTWKDLEKEGKITLIEEDAVPEGTIFRAVFNKGPNLKPAELPFKSASEEAQGIARQEQGNNINPEQIKPDISGIAPLQKRINNMEERLARVDAAQYALQDIENVRQNFRRRISKYKDAYLKEELTGIPSSYLTKEGGIKPDEAIDELRNHFGVEVNDEVGLKEYLKNLDKARNDLLDEIETNKPQFVTKRETTLLNERIKAVEQGIREGKLQAREEIKDIQKQFVEMIEESGLSANDKAKFFRFEKNIQTPEQFQKAIPEIISRIQLLKNTGEKKAIEKQIGRELKYTKPVKEGQRRVGRYDYETNKFFEEIRRINNLGQEEAQAELDAMPAENLTQMDIIKTRMLFLTTNGMSGSLDLHKQVLEDIQLIKQIGEEAKDEADFVKKLQRHRAVEEISESIDKIKGDKDSIITKIENAYRLGFSNIYSMLNSIAGKEVAEKYDPEPKENNREIAIFEKVNETADRIAEMLGVDNFPAVVSAFQDMAVQEFEIVDSEGLKTEINKLGLIDIYNSIKNDVIRDRYFNAFGEEQIQELLNNLTPAEEAVADYLQESVQGYREVLNQRSIEITGRDLGEVINYWPATSEYQQNVTDDIRLQGETPSALKARSQSAYVIPIPKDAWLKFLKHVSQSEHVQHLSREYEMLKRIFQDRKIKNQITNKFGEDVYKTLLAQIDNISLNKQTERLDAISEAWGVMVNNWVKAKVALNPSIFFKQLISVVNYAENMPAGEWSVGFFKGLASPKETFDFMWKNSKGFLEERYNKGYSEALREAIKGASGIEKHKFNWATGLTYLARAGDISAVAYGGYPYVQWQISQGKTVEEAFDAFRRATLKSQQSGLSSGLSQYQNSKNSAWRIYLAFKNTANQYLRKQVDAIISYRNEEIPTDKLAKITLIYSVINPLLYALVGYGITKGWKEIGKALFGTKERRRRETDDDLVSSLMIQLAINPFEAVFVLNDISEYVARRVARKNTYGVISTPVIDDISKAFQKIGKKNPTLMDYFEGSGTFAELGTGLPILTGLRIFKNLTGEKKGPLSTPIKKIGRNLGF